MESWETGTGIMGNMKWNHGEKEMESSEMESWETGNGSIENRKRILFIFIVS